MDMIPIDECYYSTTTAACLELSADMRKGSANNKHKQLAPKVGTKS